MENVFDETRTFVFLAHLLCKTKIGNKLFTSNTRFRFSMSVLSSPMQGELNGGLLNME